MGLAVVIVVRRVRFTGWTRSDESARGAPEGQMWRRLDVAGVELRVEAEELCF